ISDLEEVPEWAKEEVTYMVSRGLVSLDNGYLGPNDSVTMNEINEIITKIHSFTHKTEDGSIVFVN
ncbi:MAG: S-layer homology domain-containing protein, partial [Clostridia bacterium]|nr:S-layer homology domain-containing protein [Clostridia bacterium]